MTATLTEPTVTGGCDRCGAPARLRVVFPNGLDLLMCGHHGAAHRPALDRLGVRLEERPR